MTAACVAGLRAAGHQVDVIELAGAHPLADGIARDAACAAWDALAETSRPLIDGLALPAFAGMDDALAARGAMALIHHPTALETGHGEDDRARLRGIEQRLLPRLARVIVTSEPTAERLSTEFGVPRARIAVVMPGTDDAPRSPRLRRPDLRDPVDRHAGAAQGPRRAAARAGAAVRSRLAPDHRRRAVARSGACRGLVALAEELGIARRVPLRRRSGR